MKRATYLSLGVVLLASARPAMAAAVWLVDKAGGGDYTSIQPAIDGASSGDGIAVAPGDYQEAIDFKGKAVRLYSTDGAESTTIDGTGHRHAVQCVSGEGPGTVLEGFTITGGNDWEPFDDITGIGQGGGIYNENSSPVVTYCIVSGNVARFGGGMYNSNGSPKVTFCTFVNNYAGNGGGLFNESGSPEVTYCAFTGNVASSSGGGLDDASGTSTMTHCTFSSNFAGNGGALSGVNAASDCTFTGNSARQGGGIFRSGTVIRCTFADNDASMGGGIFTADGVTDCILLRNVDGILDVGAVVNCTFSENLGTACLTNADIVSNCTFLDNRCAGIMTRLDRQSVVTQCTFLNNDFGIIHAQEGSTTAANCILWGSVYAAIQGPATATFCDVEGGWEGEGNIDSDPLFADSQGRLSAGSPCIDAGTNGPPGGLIPMDRDGNPRPLDGNGDGNAVADMGAYEHPAVPVQPVNPRQLLTNLIDAVAGLKLPQGIETALQAKLAAARKAMENRNKKNDMAAVNALKAFTNSVQAQQGKKIAQSDARTLMATAQQIIRLLAES